MIGVMFSCSYSFWLLFTGLRFGEGASASPISPNTLSHFSSLSRGVNPPPTLISIFPMRGGLGPPDSVLGVFGPILLIWLC